ncbi:MAG: sigma-70 family RNA polymerase sigma factor [Acidobacteriota bacterium]
MDSPSVSKSEWTLTADAFAGFLAYLDANQDRAGEKYETLRLMLVKFFDWRGAHFPEECADETFNRVIKKIEAGEEIRDIATYCRGVARLLFLETLKHPDQRSVSLDELQHAAENLTENADADRQRECFEHCLNQLPVESRQLILEYYRDEKRDKIDNRLALAERLGIPLNALRSRAQRVRNKLENCVKRCMK